MSEFAIATGLMSGGSLDGGMLSYSSYRSSLDSIVSAKKEISHHVSSRLTRITKQLGITIALT